MHKLNLTVDLAVHGLILFSFLTTFFLMYISKIEKTAMSTQLNGFINSGIKETIADARKKHGPVVDSALNMIPYNSLNANYNMPDPYTQINNSWLTETLILTNSFIFIFVVGMVLLLKKVCGAEIDMFEIMKLNVITFTCVGIIEYLFFTKVALNYVPVLPSSMITTMMGTIKNYFS